MTEWVSIGFTVHVLEGMGSDEQEEFMAKIAEVAHAHFGHPKTGDDAVKYLVTQGVYEGEADCDIRAWMNALADHHAAQRIMLPCAEDELDD